MLYLFPKKLQRQRQNMKQKKVICTFKSKIGNFSSHDSKIRILRMRIWMIKYRVRNYFPFCSYKQRKLNVLSLEKTESLPKMTKNKTTPYFFTDQIFHRQNFRDEKYVFALPLIIFHHKARIKNEICIVSRNFQAPF